LKGSHADAFLVVGSYRFERSRRASLSMVDPLTH